MCEADWKVNETVAGHISDADGPGKPQYRPHADGDDTTNAPRPPTRR
jgi:hypothetical protein